MNDERHYHIVAMCRTCGFRDLMPIGTLEDVREYLSNVIDSDTPEGVRFTLVSQNSDNTLIEFTLFREKDGHTHNYVVTYRFCEQNITACMFIAVMERAMNQAEMPESPMKGNIQPPIEGFHLPKDGFNLSNN